MSLLQCVFVWLELKSHVLTESHTLMCMWLRNFSGIMKVHFHSLHCKCHVNSCVCTRAASGRRLRTWTWIGLTGSRYYPISWTSLPCHHLPAPSPHEIACLCCSLAPALKANPWVFAQASWQSCLRMSLAVFLLPKWSTVFLTPALPPMRVTFTKICEHGPGKWYFSVTSHSLASHQNGFWLLQIVG